MRARQRWHRTRRSRRRASSVRAQRRPVVRAPRRGSSTRQPRRWPRDRDRGAPGPRPVPAGARPAHRVPPARRGGWRTRPPPAARRRPRAAYRPRAGSSQDARGPGSGSPEG